jgi:hypothetical protein
MQPTACPELAEGAQAVGGRVEAELAPAGRKSNSHTLIFPPRQRRCFLVRKTGSSNPRDPPPHRAPVFLIRLAELPSQRRLLIENDKQFDWHGEKCRISPQYRRPENDRLADNHSKNADVHRIPHIPVQRSRDKKFRGSDGRWRPQPTNRELPRATKVNRCSDKNYNTADPRQQPALRPRETAAQQPARDHNQHRPRRDEGEQHGLEYRPNRSGHVSGFPPQQDSRPHLTVKLKTTEESRDAASGASRLNPRMFRLRIRKHSIHNHPHEDGKADCAAQILILEKSGDIPHGRRRKNRKDSRS